MSYLSNDLSILDLKRKADSFLSASKIFKDFYCFTESVKIKTLVGLIS